MSDQLANEERLRLLVQNAADVIAVIDGEGIVTYVSPSVTRMLGFEPAGLIGTSAFDFVHPDDLAGVRETVELADTIRPARRPSRRAFLRRRRQELPSRDSE